MTITTRLVDTVSTPLLLRTVQSQRIDPERLIIHRFKLHDVLAAHDTFVDAAETKALEVILEA